MYITDFCQTKGLTLEEVNRAFGDNVQVEMADITDEVAGKAIVQNVQEVENIWTGL